MSVIHDPLALRREERALEVNMDVTRKMGAWVSWNEPQSAYCTDTGKGLLYVAVKTRSGKVIRLWFPCGKQDWRKTRIAPMGALYCVSVNPGLHGVDIIFDFKPTGLGGGRREYVFYPFPRRP